MKLDRDLNIIEKIYKYCLQIDEAHNMFNQNYEIFKINSVYKNSVCLCLMQIGELANNLSENFKTDNKDIPWREIRGMRNIVAHEYGHIDYEIVWETIEDSVPELKKFCENKLGL
ncbi:MAG: DUF86 domain-containing protein [Ruminococcaceae bacterium]|nr:DUF86 domain-containing protein [Oscillospiraceae bacterium]